MNLEKPRSVVIAPDSFKGCLDAAAVARAIATGVRKACPTAQITELPLADGGEGSMDCLATARPNAVWRSAEMTAVHGETITARWLQVDADTAILESAEVLGLPLVKQCGPDIHQRGSDSLGRLMLAALDAGCTRLFLALGGSATNDAGIGMLQALGLRFTRGDGADAAASLAGLLEAKNLDASGLDSRLSAAELTVLCDVDNPLTGPNGATHTYGPQKNLAADELDSVDAAMAEFAALCSSYRPVNANTAGAGAAGGLGFALALLGAELASGAERVLELCGFEDQLPGCQLVITGEGRADLQTLNGKLPAAVAAMAARHSLPVALIAGAVAADARAGLAKRFVTVDSLSELAGSSEEAIANAAAWLETAGEQLGRQLD